MYSSGRLISGIVTDSKNKGDTGKFIEVFTNDGPVRVFASGARRLSSKFLPLTKLFSLVSLECTPSGDFYILTQGRQLASFDSIEKDAIKFCIAADVIRNMRIVAQSSPNADKLGALLHVYIKRLNELGDYEDDKFAILTATDKLYIYVLAYCGIDVLASAAQQRHAEALIGMCNYYKGKKVSDAMLDEKIFTDSQAAYFTLSDIYAGELDVRLDKSIIM